MNEIITPDRYVIVKMSTGEHVEIYKVFAGWYGGYLTGNSWKLNSGIRDIVKHHKYTDFKGYSGSTYRCADSAYGMSGYMTSIAAELFAPMPGVDFHILSEEEAVSFINQGI